MSDEEMNIDEGTFVDSFLLAPGRHILSFFAVANGGGPVRKRGRGFQSSAGTSLSCAVFYVLVLMPISYPQLATKAALGQSKLTTA
jgi:hypothetical protein